MIRAVCDLVLPCGASHVVTTSIGSKAVFDAIVSPTAGHGAPDEGVAT